MLRHKQGKKERWKDGKTERMQRKDGRREEGEETLVEKEYCCVSMTN